MSDERIRLPRSHDGGIYGLVVHGETLVSGGGEGTITFQGMDGATLRDPVPLPDDAGVLGMALGPDGATALVGHMGGALFLDLAAGACRPVEGPEGWVRAVAWSAGACVAVGDDKTLWSVSPEGAERLAKLGGILHRVALCVVRDQSLVVTVDSWRSLEVYAFGTKGGGVERRWQCELPDDDVPRLCSLGDTVAVAGDEGPIRVFDAWTGDLVRELASPAGVSAMYRDEAGLITGHRDLALRLWSVDTGACERDWPSGHEEWINVITRTPEGHLITGDDGGSLAVPGSLAG